jgi:hemerythrin
VHHVKEFIRWGPDLELGIPELDEQHRTLVDLANRLYEEFKEKRDGQEAKRAVTALFVYSDTHFAAEEAYFARYNFASLEQHVEAHSTFMAKAAEFEDRLASGTPAEAAELLDFLKVWIKRHIGREDRELVRIARRAVPHR